MTHILYISDNNLRLQFFDGNGFDESVPIVRSQGYAWFKGDQVIFDTDKVNTPIKFCRLAPEQMNSRYWQQCEKSSINNNAAGMRNAADILWKHINELKEQNNIKQLVLVVPSHYQSSNLQLLLGIIQSLEINVTAIINGALLALKNKLSSDGRVVHLDVQLHQTVASYIDVKKGIAKLGDVEIIQSVGIQAMHDALLKTLQAHFIQNDRFDPLHNAETEQQLFDNLSDIALQVNLSAKAVVNVEFQNQLYSTSIDDKVWNEALAPFIEQLLVSSSKAEHAFIQMNASFDHRALPQLMASKVTLLKDLLLSKVPSLASQNNSSGSLEYVTELKVSKPSAKPLEKKAAPQPELQPRVVKKAEINTGSLLTGVATHLLQSGVAVPITQAELKMDGQQLTLHASTTGNAQALLSSGKLIVLRDESCKEFNVNDRIGSHLVDGVVTVIEVLGDASGS